MFCLNLLSYRLFILYFCIFSYTCSSDYIIIISDVDEIPSLEQVEALPGELEEKNVVSLPMVVSYQYVNLLDRGGKAFWRKAKALQSDYRSFSVRLDSAPSVGGSPGQHFRYLAHQVPQLAQKHRDFAHAELDVPEPIIAEIYSIANEYDVAPLPLIDHPGAGLLTSVGVSEMSAPAKFIAKSEPRLYKEEIKKELFVTRIAASHQISKLYAQKPDGIQFAGRENKSWAMVLSGLSFQVLAHLGFMTIWRAVRRIILNRRPLPRQRLVHFLRGVNLFGDWEIQKYSELGNLQVMCRSWTES